MTRSYRNWFVGPGKVIEWPHRPKRAIIVREVQPDRWEGIFRLGGKVQFRTQVGPQDLVMRVLIDSNNRCGLPIVIATAAPQKRRRIA